MHNKPLALACSLLLLLASSLPAQAAVRLDNMFGPLLADPMEPRIAVMPWLDEDYLQLDIGASADLYRNDSETIAVGIDFGTWSLLQRSDNFKFPVDTIDYLFGINMTYRNPLDEPLLGFDEFSTRIRLSHISAHFEDGHYDEDTDEWMNPEATPFGTIPFTYSREFINLVAALSNDRHRVYFGYQFLWHTIPDEISRHAFQAGVELSTPGNTYLAADFKLLPEWNQDKQETDGFRGTWNLQAGWRLTTLGLGNVRVACNYFNGMSRHGMYFNHDEEYTTLGVIVDL